tara:strand:- start:651 stop:1733 length:1083 start_codon:yes stop_codon:yes gene_type:complete
MAGDANLQDYTKAGFEEDRNSSRLNGQIDWIEDGFIGATQISRQVNDGDTLADWTESDSGTWDVTAVSNNAKVSDNTNGMRIETTAATDGTQYIQTLLIDGSAVPGDKIGTKTYMSWEDTDYMCFWMAAHSASDFNAAGEALVTFLYLDADGVVTETSQQSLAAAVGAEDTNAIAQITEIDIASVLGVNRKRVHGIRIYANNSATGQGIVVSGFLRYKHSNGKGPVWGRCIKVPITGTNVLTRGQLVQLDVDTSNGIGVSEEAAAAVNTLGPVVVGGTGTANGKVYATVQISGLAYLRANAATVLGEGVIWQSEHATHGHLVEGGATGVDENTFAKTFMTGPGQFADNIHILGHSGSFIS